jgi:DNA-directed RNA polymerase II subunit RPB1
VIFSGTSSEKQNIETFGLNDQEFEHNYRVDVTLAGGGFLPGVLQPGIDDTSLELQSKLDEEYTRLVEDRRLLREFIFPRAPTTSPHYLPVNLQRIVQNAMQIFHIDRRKPSNLNPAYIVDAVNELGKRLTVVLGEDALSHEAQENSTLMF